LGKYRRRLLALQSAQGRPHPKQAHMPLLVPPIRPTSWQLQERGRAFPPNYLHETWRDWLYWDVELEA
jgi:hypothetical protein